METAFDEHLSPEQFDQLALKTGGLSGDPVGANAESHGAANATESPDVTLEASRVHIGVCDFCRAKAKAYEVANMKLNRLNFGSMGKIGPDCPDPSEWPWVAAGFKDRESARDYLRHAAQCDHCGPLLRAASANFVDDFTAEEQQAMAGLNSLKSSWQAQMAERLSSQSKERGQIVPKFTPRRGGFKDFLVALARPARWPVWVYGGAAAAFVVTAGLLVLFRPHSESAERLLAQAYSEQRTVEVRFSGAPYGPIRTERSGNEQSRFNKSPALLEAEALIARRLQAEPSSPVWLDAKGRAEVLDGNYQAAIETFKKALDLDPNSAPLLTDAASAYYERASLANRGLDYGTAIELLSRSLINHPGDTIALYNRALAYEKMFLYRQAADDWQNYLKLDPKSDWAKEAREHLEALQRKISGQEHRATEPLVSPEAFLREANSHDEIARASARSKAEDYLNNALREWLPLAFSVELDHPKPPASPAAKSESAVLAVHALAQILNDDHNDPWLSDLLAVSPSPAMPAAIHALSEAVEANATSQFAMAKRESGRAAELFRGTGNIAGELRSQLEMAYALTRSYQGGSCLAATRQLAGQLAIRRYPWMLTQLYMEQTTCWAQTGEFNQIQIFADRALASARKSGYGTQYLRAVGMAASLESKQGNSAAAYALDREGLARYWEGNYPPMRAYQFYSDLGYPAETVGRWHFALALAKEAASTVALTEQHVGEAMARDRLAKIALRTDNRDLALREFDHADRLFAALSPSAETQNYRADADISLAKLEAERGEVDRSWAHLAQARSQLSRVSHYFVALEFYKAMGELQIRKGNEAEAQKALGAAVGIAERGFASLKDERERMKWALETDQVYRTLAQLKWQAHDPQGALGEWEWYRGAAVRGFPSQNGAPKRQQLDFDRLETSSLPRFQELLPKLTDLTQETVISYLQLPGGLVIWAFDDRGVNSRWATVSPQEVERHARRFRDECANPQSDVGILRRDARELYDLLLAPIADRLQMNRTLVIEPDKAMAEISFAALVSPAGRYFGEDFALVISPGLLYQRRMRQPANWSPRQRALVVGAPSLTGRLAATLEPLEDAAQESEQVASQFRSATLLTGSQATLAAVLRDLPRASIFHFAGHALDTPERTGLLLANPSLQDATAETAILDASALTPMRLRQTQLAVFSACSTAGEWDESSSSSESLVRLFLRAGVPHVVASRWNVESRTTASFMRSFYDLLLQGKSPPFAVKAAAAKVREQTATSHPYYWAAFSAFGR